MSPVDAQGRDAAGQQLAKLYNEGSGAAEQVTTASGATATTVVSDSSKFTTSELTLSGATPVIQVPAPRLGARKIIHLVQDATGSRVASWTVTGGGSIKWVGAAAPTLSTAAGKRDKITLEASPDGTFWIGQAALNIS